MVTRVWCLGLVVLFTTSSPAEARQSPPTVAVAGFTVESGTKLKTAAIDAMTDQLADTLVESGRFRALDRAWLGIESGKVSGSIDRIRAKAGEAGVDYLIVGRLAKFSELIRHMPGPLAPRGLPMMGPPRGRFPFGSPSIRPITRIDHLRVSVDVVDVRTGALLTRTTETCRMPGAKGLANGPRPAVLPAKPLLAVAAALVARPRNSQVLDSDLGRIVTAIGQTLIRWKPPTDDGR